MKTIQLYLLAFCLLATGCFTSCDMRAKYTEEEFLIEVDSIRCPDTVQLQKPFKLIFFGRIGENGCYRFSRFHTVKSENMIDIQAIGLRKVGSNLICPENLPLLDGTELELKADSLGLLSLKVINPGVNRFITKKINVVE